MALALEEAEQAALEGEVPVGCILVDASGREVGRGHNLREQTHDVTAHAEVVAMRRVSRVASSWRLEGVTAYVTLEPCVMCAAALVQSRIPRIVFGCDDPKAGGLVSLYSIGSDRRLNHQVSVTRGVREDEASAQLRTFFCRLRRAGKK